MHPYFRIFLCTDESFCAAGRRYQSDSEKLFPKSHRFYLCRRYFIERTRFFISETQFKISFSPLGSGNGRYFVQLLCPWPYAPVGCFHARQAVSLCRSYLFLHFFKGKNKRLSGVQYCHRFHRQPFYHPSRIFPDGNVSGAHGTGRSHRRRRGLYDRALSRPSG